MEVVTLTCRDNRSLLPDSELRQDLLLAKPAPELQRIQQPDMSDGICLD